VGAGPSGLYTTEHLLEQQGLAVEVDLYERLPNPWGLVRSGVAPDHPEKKLIIDRHFAHLLQDARVRLLGNIEVGTDVGHAELSTWYDAVVYTTGAAGDVSLGLPGEDLPGCFSAREFVGFYNGHPDLSDLAIDLSVERAVVIGNGNVALDVARILTLPFEELSCTDISDVALTALKKSKIREVIVMGRRGHLQAAFKNPELEELESLTGVDVIVDERGLPAEDEIESESDPTARRKLRTLRRMARPGSRSGLNKRIVLRFCESPVRFGGVGRLEEIEVVRNRLEQDQHGRLRSRPTDERHMIGTGLALKAVGYRGLMLSGLPFDDLRGVIMNNRGRVCDQAGNSVPGVYVAGWAKRGCQGIIGSNKKCAAETVGNLICDFSGGKLESRALLAPVVLAELQSRRSVVLTDDWSVIDHAERSKGRQAGRPRVKFTDREEILRTAHSKFGGQK
jgi:ferredoxin--NADP+ reductase